MKTDNKMTFRLGGKFGLLIAFALVSVAYLVLCWTSRIYDLRGDGAGYMLGAAYFSPFHVASPVLTEYAKSIVYPPLFPVLIGVFGGSGLAAHLVVVISLLLAVLAIHLWLRADGQSLQASASAALLFALLPATYLQALNIWTENTFLMLNMFAVYFVARAVTPDVKRQRFWWLAAVAVAAATLTRVAALPLLGAFLLFLTIHRPQRFIKIGVLAALPFLAWVIWSKLTQTGIETYTSHWATSYQQNTAARLLSQLSAESVALIHAWGVGFAGEGASTLLKLLATVFGMMGIVGWSLRLVSLKFDAIYVALYALLLLTWPHPEEALRYGYVLFPFVVAYAMLLAARIEDKFSKHSEKLPATLVLGIAMAIVMLPGLVLNLSRFLQEVPADISGSNRIDEWYAADRTRAERASQFHHRMQEHLKVVKMLVPEDACIFAIKPTVITYHTQRTSYSPPIVNVQRATFERQIARCRYVYGLGLVSPSYNVPLYPINELGSRAKILTVIRFPAGGAPGIVGALAEILPPTE